MINLSEYPTIDDALAAYRLNGEVVDIKPYGCGHINRTLCVTVSEEDGSSKYILQRISRAFKEPQKLMENIAGITDFLSEKIIKKGGDPLRETLCVIRTESGEPLYYDKDGLAWRMYRYIEGTVCLQSADTPELFFRAAKSFGNFQRLLSDYPSDSLHDTIERFHDTENRLELLKQAVALDKLDRVKNVENELKFVFEREKDCSVLQEALRRGELPLRVTHNDTKLNNVLLDEQSGEGICIVDLDTVMKGLSVNDFGDAIRFGANHCAEDETDLDKVNFDLSLYEIFTKGFLDGCGDILTEAEKKHLAWGAKTMTLECGMRFLTDYLDGDNYFHIEREGQNLDRARTQFKLVFDMEECWDDMCRVALIP